MKTPEIQLKRTEKPAATRPTKESIIKAKGYGEALTVTSVKKPTVVVELGKDLSVNSLSTKVQIKNNDSGRDTTTCCDNDLTRGDGSCPPSACTKVTGHKA